MAVQCFQAIWWSQWRASNIDNYLAAARGQFAGYNVIPKRDALSISRAFFTKFWGYRSSVRGQAYHEWSTIVGVVLYVASCYIGPH